MSPAEPNQTPLHAAAQGMEEDGSDGDEGLDTGSHPIPSQRLSCEQCRQKKVKCDRRDPCTPCFRKKIYCSFPAGFKPRQKRQRTLVSNSQEEKIDEISRKLDRLCVAVSSFNASPSAGEGWRPAQLSMVQRPTPSYESPTTVPAQSDEDAPDAELEGELSLNAHAAFATEYVQQAMRGKDATPEMTTSLETLRRIVGADEAGVKTPRETYPKLLDPHAPTGDIRLPPLQLAMSCLQKAKESDRMKFLCTFEFESIGQFVEYLLPVYSGEPSVAQMIIVNAGLHLLFKEWSNEETQQAAKKELKGHGQACRQNLEVLLARLPFNLPSSFDYVLALFQASMHYLDMCKPSASWKYIAAASQMAQTLGFHRELALVPESEDVKRRRTRLFWLIVMMDKALALRLGRSSTIRDSDLTLSRVDVEKGGYAESCWVIPEWIDWALLQGRIYDDIFSPGALQQPGSIRAVRARALATELQKVYDSTTVLENRYLEARRQAFGEVMDELVRRAERVSHLATMTLIYRSLPANPYSGSAFCEECVATAHEALEEHQRCLALLKNVGDNMIEMYIQWAILSSPFVPFIVLFCRVVETPDSVHLDKLLSVVEALQMVPSGLPEAYRKQLRLFQVMYDVACRYVEAKGRGPVRHVSTHISDSDFETFFKEAGITLPHVQPSQGISQSSQGRYEACEPVQANDSIDLGLLQGTFVPRAENHGTELGNWFDQNHQMFRMMEDSF